MRRNNCGRGCCGRAGGCIAIVLGVLILLGLILPAGFWWVICAAHLRRNRRHARVGISPRTVS